MFSSTPTNLQDDDENNAAFNEVIRSIPDDERDSVLAELDSSFLIASRAKKLQEQLFNEEMVIENESEARNLFLAALQLLKQHKITVGQFASLHILDSAFRTLYTHRAPNIIDTYIAKSFRNKTVNLFDTTKDSPEQISRFHFDSATEPSRPLIHPKQLLQSFFNFRDSEWNEFAKQMQAAPRSEQFFQVLATPIGAPRSTLISIIQRILRCMREITWKVETADGGVQDEKIMLVPSFSMFQAAINAKAQTLNRNPVELLPTYGYIKADHYAILKASGKLAAAMYLPERQEQLRYQDSEGRFRTTIDGHLHETAFAGFIHDVYHAMREMAMSENVAKARFRLAAIAKKHPKNKINADSRKVSSILIDGELIHSHDPRDDTMFDPNSREIFGEIFGKLFYVPALKDRLHADLKRAFIKDMVVNKDVWEKEFNLGRYDLMLSDSRIYDAIEAEQQQLIVYSPTQAMCAKPLIQVDEPKPASAPKSTTWFQSIKDSITSYLPADAQTSSQRSPVSVAGASLTDNIMLLTSVMPYVSQTLFPWCKEYNLTATELLYLKEQQRLLTNYHATFPVRHEQNARQLGLLNDKFADLHSLMKSTTNLISNAINKNKISSSDMSSIKNKMKTIEQLNKKLFNPKLKHELRQRVRQNVTTLKRTQRKGQHHERAAVVSQRGFFSCPESSSALALGSTQRLATLDSPASKEHHKKQLGLA